MTPLSIYTLILRCVCGGVYSVEYVKKTKLLAFEVSRITGQYIPYCVHKA